MDFTGPFDAIFRETGTVRAEGAGAGAARTRGSDASSRMTKISSGKLGTTSKPNFSYPRPEGRQPSCRHESSYSRSSVTSENSLPGMTDSSDSDVSLDDDYCQYNASASELWDSFWPSSNSDDDNKTPPSSQGEGQSHHGQPQGQDQINGGANSNTATTTQRPPRATQQGYFTFDFLKHYTDDADDDTITISTPLEEKTEGTAAAVVATTKETTHQWSRESAPSPPSLRSSPRRPNSKRYAATYSVYPKPQLLPPPRLLHPPRTSSLNSQQDQLQPPPHPPPPAPLQQQQLNLPGDKSTHNEIEPHALSTSPIVTTTVTAATAKSVPVSPAYPPPPAPRALRPSVSAFNLRERLLHINTTNNHTASSSSSGSSQSCEKVRHNPTAPPPPCFEPLAAQQEQNQGQSEGQRFVSVFELDSDAESLSENSKDSSHGSSNGSGNGHSGSGGGGGGGSGANKFAKRLLLASRSRSVHGKKSSGSGGRAKKRNGSSSAGAAPIAAIDTVAANAIGVGATASAPSSCFTSPTLPSGGFGELNFNINSKEKEREGEKVSGGGGVKRSPSRKRGGSLGRILGLKSR